MTSWLLLRILCLCLWERTSFLKAIFANIVSTEFTKVVTIRLESYYKARLAFCSFITTLFIWPRHEKYTILRVKCIFMTLLWCCHPKFDRFSFDFSNFIMSFFQHSCVPLIFVSAKGICIRFFGFLFFFIIAHFMSTYCTLARTNIVWFSMNAVLCCFFRYIWLIHLTHHRLVLAL